MLFGNFDLLFVAFYGLVLLAVVPAAPSRRWVVGAGIAVAVATLTKLHPAVLGVWLLARGVRELRHGGAGLAGRTAAAQKLGRRARGRRRGARRASA